MFRTRAPQTCMYLNLETRLAHLICIISHIEVKQATSHSNQTEENTIGIQHAVKKSTLESESMQHKIKLNKEHSDLHGHADRPTSLALLLVFLLLPHPLLLVFSGHRKHQINAPKNKPGQIRNCTREKGKKFPNRKKQGVERGREARWGGGPWLPLRGGG